MITSSEEMGMSAQPVLKTMVYRKEREGMSKINYNEISQIYDDVREGDLELINEFLEEISLTTTSKILDIGCGTANYTNLIQRFTKAQVYGMDQSEGMLSKAAEKNNSITLKLGNAEHIPFENNMFDFIYMTDVIHHVPNIDKMFSEIFRVIKTGGKVCICTQSHKQIENRLPSLYFPSTAVVDKKRYPEIDQIIASAEKSNLKFIKSKCICENQEVHLDEKYLELFEKKGYSMLHLIPEEEYQLGLKRFREELAKGPIIKQSAGGTLVWFIK